MRKECRRSRLSWRSGTLAARGDAGRRAPKRPMIGPETRPESRTHAIVAATTISPLRSARPPELAERELPPQFGVGPSRAAATFHAADDAVGSQARPRPASRSESVRVGVRRASVRSIALRVSAHVVTAFDRPRPRGREAQPCPTASKGPASPITQGAEPKSNRTSPPTPIDPKLATPQASAGLKSPLRLRGAGRRLVNFTSIFAGPGDGKKRR